MLTGDAQRHNIRPTTSSVLVCAMLGSLLGLIGCAGAASMARQLMSAASAGTVEALHVEFKLYLKLYNTLRLAFHVLADVSQETDAGGFSRRDSSVARCA